MEHDISNSQSTIKYKTENFYAPLSWVKRIFFTSLFYAIVLYNISGHGGFNSTNLLVFALSYFLIIIAGQFDELIVTEEKIIVQQRSLIPFLRSELVISFAEIDLVKQNSNFVNNDGHWFFLLHKAERNLEINLKDGSCEIISGKLHPNGINGIKKFIREYEESLKNSTP